MEGILAGVYFVRNFFFWRVPT